MMTCHSSERTKEQKIETLHDANGWIIRRLKQWHMTVFPKELLNYAPIRTYERLISEIVGTKCEIRQTGPGCYIVAEVEWK